MRGGLLQIYDQLAGDLQQLAPVCELSGRCCRFEEYGHTLFLSRPEAELLVETVWPAGAAVTRGSCPFQVGKVCTARENRPFGCRVYFCDPRYEGQAERLSEQYLAELKRLHEQTATDWEYRPLYAFLQELSPTLRGVTADNQELDDPVASTMRTDAHMDIEPQQRPGE